MEMNINASSVKLSGLLLGCQIRAQKKSGIKKLVSSPTISLDLEPVYTVVMSFVIQELLQYLPVGITEQIILMLSSIHRVVICCWMYWVLFMLPIHTYGIVS